MEGNISQFFFFFFTSFDVYNSAGVKLVLMINVELTASHKCNKFYKYDDSIYVDKYHVTAK